MLPSPTRATLLLAALLAGAACGDSDANADANEGPCPSEQQSLRVTGEVAIGTRDKALVLPQDMQILLAIDEDSSILRCADGLVTESTPGATIGSARLGAPGAFDLQVERTVYDVSSSSLWLRGLLDLDGNGACDPGELTGSVVLGVPDDAEGERVLQGRLVLEDEGCPARL